MISISNVGAKACYNTGKITGKSGSVGSIAGGVTTNSYTTDCYFLTGTADKAIGNTNAAATVKPFASNAWPANSASINWGVANGSNGGTGGYFWKSLGSFSGSVYPKLWWE
jgi:hypothetical protein